MSIEGRTRSDGSEKPELAFLVLWDELQRNLQLVAHPLEHSRAVGGFAENMRAHAAEPQRNGLTLQNDDDNDDDDGNNG